MDGPKREEWVTGFSSEGFIRKKSEQNYWTETVDERIVSLKELVKKHRYGVKGECGV